MSLQDLRTTSRRLPRLTWEDPRDGAKNSEKHKSAARTPPAALWEKYSEEDHRSTMKVVIAGAGIAGNAMLRHLRSRVEDVRAYEQRSIEDASPPGLNVLMSHNGMAVVRSMDPELYDAMVATGSSMVNWSARTVTGDVLYHLPDVVEAGLAAEPALLARWDHIHAATRCDDLTEYSTRVVDVEMMEDSSQLRVQILHTDTNETEWITDVDYLIAADGRYSMIRQKLAPPVSYFGPPYLADFRIVVHGVDNIDELFPSDAPMWRVYNKPDLEAVVQEHGEHPAIVQAASAYVRVGLMKLEENTLGVFGNIPIVEGEKPDAAIKNGKVLASLFRPSKGSTPDRMGKFVIDMLLQHGDEGHWTRKQETDSCYEAMDGKVLFIGDSAGAIYPSLGQGANLSLEDAAVAAAAFPNTKLIASLRKPRREFIKEMSRRHALHVSIPETFEAEINNWAQPGTKWRSDLRRLWGCSQQLALRGEVATKENIGPYGQLISESLDGDVFDPTDNDAALDLSNGTPRLYLMKLTGGRPLVVNQITRHRKVTQCLGAVHTEKSFYLVMHAPTDSPTLHGLRALRIPPRHFIKLHVGTWHAGPLWEGQDDCRTFINLELSDTNVNDHDTIRFSEMRASESVEDSQEDAAERGVLGLPVLSSEP